MRKDVLLGEQPFCVECEATVRQMRLKRKPESDCRKSWLPQSRKVEMMTLLIHWGAVLVSDLPHTQPRLCGPEGLEPEFQGNLETLCFVFLQPRTFSNDIECCLIYLLWVDKSLFSYLSTQREQQKWMLPRMPCDDLNHRNICSESYQRRSALQIY